VKLQEKPQAIPLNGHICFFACSLLLTEKNVLFIKKWFGVLQAHKPGRNLGKEPCLCRDLR